MSFSVVNKSEIIKEFQASPNDTATPEVQVALLSARIDRLTTHFKAHNTIMNHVVVCCVW